MAQTGAGAKEETESPAGSARDREGRTALSSLPSSRLPTCLCWPRRGWEMARACGPAVGNRQEQGRAGSGREQADQLPARAWSQGCYSPQTRPSCSQETQGSRGGGMDTGQTKEERAARWGAGRVHPEANNSRSPSPAREEMPRAARAKGLVLRWKVTSGTGTPGPPSPHHPTSPWLQTPGAVGRNCAVQTSCCGRCSWPQRCPSGSITTLFTGAVSSLLLPASERAGQGHGCRRLSCAL